MAEVIITYACSRSGPNAMIEHKIIWILAWKLHFSSGAAACGSSRRAHCRAGRAPAGAASGWLTSTGAGGRVEASLAPAPQDHGAA